MAPAHVLDIEHDTAFSSACMLKNTLHITRKEQPIYEMSPDPTLYGTLNVRLQIEWSWFIYTYVKNQTTYDPSLLGLQKLDRYS